MDKPTTPCNACGQKMWYWPGDYFIGKKVWMRSDAILALIQPEIEKATEKIPHGTQSAGLTPGCHYP